jgi:hypothetical protein
MSRVYPSPKATLRERERYAEGRRRQREQSPGSSD